RLGAWVVDATRRIAPLDVGHANGIQSRAINRAPMNYGVERQLRRRRGNQKALGGAHHEVASPPRLKCNEALTACNFFSTSGNRFFNRIGQELPVTLAV